MSDGGALRMAVLKFLSSFGGGFWKPLGFNKAAAFHVGNCGVEVGGAPLKAAFGRERP